MDDQLDPRAILRALGIDDAARITPVTGGRDTVIYRVERGAEVYALRVFGPEQGAIARRELLAMTAAAAGGIPVPRVHAGGMWQGRPALLLAWVSGQPVFHALAARPELLEPLGDACGRLLAGIHTLPAPELGASGTWLDWAGLGDEPLREALERVARHDRLLHLDYHPLNVMADATDGATISGVLDWANALAGDPRADLARTIAILRLDAEDVPAAYRPAVAAFERALVAGYEAAAGPQPELALFHAWAGRAMLRDAAPRLAANPAQRARIEAWVARWLAEAGIG